MCPVPCVLSLSQFFVCIIECSRAILRQRCCATTGVGRLSNTAVQNERTARVRQWLSRKGRSHTTPTARDAGLHSTRQSESIWDLSDRLFLGQVVGRAFPSLSFLLVQRGRGAHQNQHVSKQNSSGQGNSRGQGRTREVRASWPGGPANGRMAPCSSASGSS